MSRFQVSTESLLTGSALIDTSGILGGLGRLGAVSGAAAQTPVAGAWADFVARADRALLDADDVSRDLARALVRAADAYALSDQTAAASMETSGS